MEVYKNASMLGLRFNTSKGVLSVEQLWQLSQTDLSTCVKNVKKSLKKSDDDELSFLDNSVTVDTTEQLRFDILKDVYLTKKSLAEAERTAKERKENNQKIMALIQEKKEGQLQSKSIEELEAMLQ